MKSNETPAQESVHVSEWTLGMWLHESDSCSVVSDSLWPHGLYWNSPGQNTEWIAFPFSRQSSQGSNPGLLHCGLILYQLSHKGSPRILQWVAYPFSSRSSWPRNRTRVSCIAGGFFTNWAICYSQKFFVLPRGGSRENKHEELHEELPKAGYWQRRYKIEGTCET